MCSGCSGDYAGGFDSDDSDEPIGAGDSALSAGFSGTTDAGLGASDWGEAGGAEPKGGEPAGLEVPEAAWEACEILVTDTQIIEIRVISLHSQANSAPIRPMIRPRID